VLVLSFVWAELLTLVAGGLLDGPDTVEPAQICLLGEQKMHRVQDQIELI
jgi:hypothetical protein